MILPELWSLNDICVHVFGMKFGRPTKRDGPITLDWNQCPLDDDHQRLTANTAHVSLRLFHAIHQFNVDWQSDQKSEKSDYSYTHSSDNLSRYILAEIVPQSEV